MILDNQKTEEGIKTDFKGDLIRIEEIYKLKESQQLERITHQKAKILEMERNFKNFVLKIFECKFFLFILYILNLLFSFQNLAK